MEIIDIIAMSLAIGYMFKDLFRNRPKFSTPEDLIARATQSAKNLGNKFLTNDFWYAVALVAPAVIFHEFGHKFMAMFFGHSATFHAAYSWLMLGLILKLMNFGFIFFVPAYVSIPAGLPPIQNALVSFAGPLVNLIFWLGSALFIRIYSQKRLNKKQKEKLVYFSFFRKINMFLFIFNMLPIPMFDGWHVYSSLWMVFF